MKGKRYAKNVDAESGARVIERLIVQRLSKIKGTKDPNGKQAEHTRANGYSHTRLAIRETCHYSIIRAPMNGSISHYWEGCEVVSDHSVTHLCHSLVRPMEYPLEIGFGDASYCVPFRTGCVVTGELSSRPRCR